MLMHYGFWPLVLKIASFSIITALGYEKNLLRQGLILLPASFLEGWLVAIAIRYALLAERSPQPLNSKVGADTPQAFEARRAILAGILIYILIKMAAAFLGGMLTGLTTDQPKDPPAITIEMYIGMLAMTGILVWAFRFAWIYVPAMMGIRVSSFLNIIKGFNSSLYIVGLWIMSMVPALIALLLGAKFLMMVFPSSAPGTVSLAYMQSFSALQAFIGMVIAIVSSVAFAHGVKEMTVNAKPRRV